MNDTPAQTPSNEGKMGVTLEFSSDSPLRAPSKNTTKATATESMTDETLVSNMVILQYDMRNEEGQLVGVQYVDGVSQSGSNVQVSVSLEPLRKTRVVVLANMTGYFDSESVALGSSLEELNRLTFPIASTDGAGIPNDYNTALPMRAESGDITLTEGQVDRLNLTLYRLVAKVIFQFYNNCEDTEADKYFSLTSITLKNVPKMGSYERVTETNYVDEQFPLRDANNFTDYSLVAGEKYGVNGKTCIWYMAPNNGGTSTGNSNSLHKMDPTRVPSNFCTYVEVAGTIYISGTAQPVTYRLYLGGNNPNDYNIWANESIQVYFNIKSLPDDPGEIPSGFNGFRISMRSSEMHSMSVTGWALGIQDVRVEPDPTTIPHTGDQYTITLTGNDSWGDPIPVRIWDGSEAVAQGRVAYDQYQEGGNITFLIPENKNKVTRSMSFQFQWDGTWITFANGTQFSTALESIGVSPDPLSIPSAGDTYTITFNGLWGDDIPVRLWNITTQSEIATGSVSYYGDHSIDLKVPENTTHDVYTIDFQYQWEGVWASIRTGAQYPTAFVTSASVSPAGTIPAAGATYDITLNGIWTGMAEVRVLNETSEMVTGKVACTLNGNSGSGTTSLEVQPNNASNATDRTITFQYRLSGGEWTDIEQRTQESSGITAATISPDPSGGFSGSTTTFTVTLTGVWQGSVPVRAIVGNSASALVNGDATASGVGVQLTVPMNSATTPRNVIFQYQWNGEWVEIARGTQEKLTAIEVPGGPVEISPETVGPTTWDQAVAYCKSKGTGWRLPTQNELMYLWGLAPSFTGWAAFAAVDYWSATQYSSNFSSAWDVNFSYGNTNYNIKTYSKYVRCVRDKGASGAYPYITPASDGGVVIVLRDDKGGVDEANLFSSQKTASPTGAENSTDNRMSRKIRVQKADPGKKTWADAKSYCEGLNTEGFSDWRLPTQRELMLIWAMGGNSNVSSGYANNTGVGKNPAPAISSSYLNQQSGFTAFAADYYWSATQNSSSSTNAWYVNFSSGHTYYYNKTSSYSVRCVRDEW